MQTILTMVAKVEPEVKMRCFSLTRTLVKVLMEKRTKVRPAKLTNKTVMNLVSVAKLAVRPKNFWNGGRRDLLVASETTGPTWLPNQCNGPYDLEPKHEL